MTARHRVSWVGLGLAGLTACALAPLQPDLGARAPTLDGFGSTTVAVTTSSEAARRAFHQGVLQAYAFNEKEAVRQFRAALAADPACAMCAWGVAWQLGPNINAPERGDLAEARQYIAHAQRHADGGTARERALIDAMSVRYGVAPRDTTARGPSVADVCRSQATGAAKADPLDVAYADRLHALVLALPDDADVLTLWAEAALVATRDDWWDDVTGKPALRVGELVDRLEKLLASRPEHTGLNHYLIHAADAPAAAARALGAAERLGKLAPMSPHLVHMPAHIFVRTGRYADATQVNEQAIAADVTLAQAQQAQGFPVSKDWRGHNTHFLWYAALMQGRGDTALAAARTLAARAKGRDSTYPEYQRSLPLLTLMRLGRWDAALAEPLAVGERGMASALGEHVHGVAQARLGRMIEARQALARVEASTQKVRAAHAKNDDFERLLSDMAGSAAARLRAEIALAEKRGDDALAEQARAVVAAKRADQGEPPMLGAGAQLALADMQMTVGHAAAAEATYRADLKAQPGSGWALQGLMRALAAQGKNAEAAALREQAERAWSAADAAMMSRS